MTDDDDDDVHEGAANALAEELTVDPMSIEVSTYPGLVDTPAEDQEENEHDAEVDVSIDDYQRTRKSGEKFAPEDAVAFAAKIMKDQLSIFINFEDEVEPEIIVEPQPEEKFNENLLRTVDELELSVRSANRLARDL